MTKRVRSDSEESINRGRLYDDDAVDFLRDAFEEYEETFIDNKLVNIEVIPDGKHKINRHIINVNNKENKTFYNEGISHLVIEGSWKDNKKNGNFTITKYITSFSILLFQIECKFIDDTIVQNESDGLTRVFWGSFINKATFSGLISEFDESNGGHFSLINGTLSFNQGDTYYKGYFENWKYNGTGEYFTINKNDGGNDFGFTYNGKFLNNKFINGCIHVFGNFNEIRINGDFSNQTSLSNLDGTYSVEFLNDKFHDGDSESDVGSDNEYDDDDEYKKYSFKIKFNNNALTRDIEEGCVYCEWCRDTVQGINLTNYNLRSKGITENTLDRCLFCLEEKPLIVFKKCRHKLYCIDCIRIIVDRKYEKLKKKVDYLFDSFTICCDKFLTLK